MAKAKTFVSETGVSIYIPNRLHPIRVNAGEPYETEDKAELEALTASSEVTEKKTREGKSDG